MHTKLPTFIFIFLASLMPGVIRAAEKPVWYETTLALLAKLTGPPTVENADAATEDEMQAYSEVITGTGVTFGMVPIRGGKFTMGSPAEEQEKFGVEDEEYFGIYNESEGPRHEVEVSPFWMGRCEVTWAEYEAWAWPYMVKREKDGAEETERDRVADALARPSPAYVDLTFDMGREGRPAIAMSLYAAQTYCKWLSVKTGRYYRLPTEAEWEYACRAGTTTAYSFGDDAADFDDYGWNYDNSNDKYQPVGRKKPNPWGLYDMHGNVREWCLDQFAVDGYQKLIDEADGKPLVNPFMPTDGKRYPGVARGGSWYDDPENCRSASRFGSSAEWNNADSMFPPSIWFESSQKYLGFRVVRPLVPPPAEEAMAFEADPEVAVKYIHWERGRPARIEAH